MLVHSSRHDASALSPQAAPSPSSSKTTPQAKDSPSSQRQLLKPKTAPQAKDSSSSQRQPLKLKDSSKPQNFSSPQPFLPFYLFTFLPLKDSSQARSFFTFFTF